MLLDLKKWNRKVDGRVYEGVDGEGEGGLLNLKNISFPKIVDLPSFLFCASLSIPSLPGRLLPVFKLCTFSFV